MNKTEVNLTDSLKKAWKQMEMMKNDGYYLVLRYLIFQLRSLSAYWLRVGEVFLCGWQPLAQRLQSLMELLSHH